jgi:putative membrane protein
MHETLASHLAFVNAILNGTSAVLLFGGWLSIRRGRRDLHWKCMAGAFIVSCLFLTSYLTRMALSGAHAYPGSGAWKAIYFTVLITHMILAITVPPLALRTLFLARKKRFAEHRRIVRYTLPIWMYVSVTGVAVYVLLYHPPG